MRSPMASGRPHDDCFCYFFVYPIAKANRRTEIGCMRFIRGEAGLMAKAWIGYMQGFFVSFCFVYIQWVRAGLFLFPKNH